MSAFARTRSGPKRQETYVALDAANLVHWDALGTRLLGAAAGDPGAIIQLPLLARQIFFQSNVVVFGLDGDPGRLAKIAVRAASGLWREIAGLRRIAAAAGAAGPAVPRILEHDRAGGRWLVEDYISGRRLDEPAFAHYLAGPAVQLYRLTARLRPARGLAGAPPDGATLPVALCHGDLAAHNVILTPEGRHCLIDWERCRVMPVALELSYHYATLPQLRPAILALLDALGAGGPAMPATRQMALALAHRLRDGGNGAALTRLGPSTLRPLIAALS